MGFLDELADTAIRGVVGYASSMPDVKNAASVLGLAEAQDGWVASEDFLDAYDVRIYDLSNDQYDVKIMKQHDFEGGYVLWNRTKDVYHTGVGSCVYKKVERHLKGYGNQAVYEDLEGGDDFAVTLYRLSSTEYDAIRDLERALRRQSLLTSIQKSKAACSELKKSPLASLSCWFAIWFYGFCDLSQKI